MTNLAGSGSGSIRQRHGSADPDPDVKQSQQFLGMVKFYRRFQPGITDTLKGDPKTLEWPPCRHFPGGQGRPGGPGTFSTPRPERRALPGYGRLRHPCGRHFAAADRGELAATGFLLKEAVRGGHPILNLRQRADGRFQRSPKF